MAAGGDVYALLLMLRARSDGFTLEQVQRAFAAMWAEWDKGNNDGEIPTMHGRRARTVRARS